MRRVVGVQGPVWGRCKAGARGRGRGRGALVILEGSEHVDDVEVVDLLEDLLLGLHVLDLQGESAAEC